MEKFNSPTTQELPLSFNYERALKVKNNNLVKDEEIILHITQDEFQIVSSFLYKFYYKILKLRLIPQNTVLSSNFWNSKNLSELSILAQLDSN